MAEQPVLLDRRQAAHRLACSVRYIDQLAAEGRLKPVRMGRLVRFTPTELDRFVATLA
ncbi:MAG: excisionase family DNA-binding protein [Planctomycetota bacterium]